MMAFPYYPTAWDIAQSEDLAPSDRLVLLALVEHADDTGDCFPGQERLAKWTGYSQRTVRASLKRLEARGVITRASRGNGKGGRSSDLTRLLIPKAATGSANRHSTNGKPADISGNGVSGNLGQGKPEAVAGEPVSRTNTSHGEQNGKSPRGTRDLYVVEGQVAA
jgi:hypothetical protein